MHPNAYELALVWLLILIKFDLESLLSFVDKLDYLVLGLVMDTSMVTF